MSSFRVFAGFLSLGTPLVALFARAAVCLCICWSIRRPIDIVLQTIQTSRTHQSSNANVDPTTTTTPQKLKKI
jgi:hypothetical protein